MGAYRFVIIVFEFFIGAVTKINEQSFHPCMESILICSGMEEKTDLRYSVHNSPRYWLLNVDKHRHTSTNIGRCRVITLIMTSQSEEVGRRQFWTFRHSTRYPDIIRGRTRMSLRYIWTYRDTNTMLWHCFVVFRIFKQFFWSVSVAVWYFANKNLIPEVLLWR